MTTALEALAEFATTLRWSDLPASTVRAARLCLLDSVGCAVGGWTLPPGRIMADLVQSYGGAPQATVIGSGQRLPLDRAAYLNGYLTNLLDFDDMLPAAGHLGASVVPTALAVAEEQAASGQALLQAIVCGYEVAARVTEAGQPSPARRAVVRGAPTWQIFGAAAAAGSLLGLTPQQMAHALGLAALHAPLPSVGRWYDRPIAPLKNNFGWIAQGGLTAALLAARGFTGKRQILEATPGAFWDMAGSDRWQPQALTADLGAAYRIEDVRFKRFPACWHIQAILAAVHQIAEAERLEPAQIPRIDVSSTDYVSSFDDTRPAGAVDCQFSLPYTIAMILLGNPAGPGWFEPALREDVQGVQALTDRVRLLPGAWRSATTPGHTPAQVDVTLHNGQRYQARCSTVPGHPARTVSAEAVEEKYLRLAAPIIGEVPAQEWLARIWALPAGQIARGWVPGVDPECS